MYDLIFYVATLLISLSVVGSASAAGYLNGAFTRGFAGVSTAVSSPYSSQLNIKRYPITFGA